MKYQKLSWPLMFNNITVDDRDELIRFLKTDPILTNGPKVLEFEEAWSKWLGVKYSIFVNSGASANLLTLAYLKFEETGFENKRTDIIAPTLTWVSDISSIIHTGFKGVLLDIDPKTLGMDMRDVEHAINRNTKAVFFTNVMGIPAGYQDVPKKLLIEDCCESHGATIQGKKVGTWGRISNFSFYFAHHMTTIEGGMVCTDDENIYETIRALRSHGMVREMRSKNIKESWHERFPTVHPSFLFFAPAYNMRSTEINAVLGLNQLKRLDENNEKRKKNFNIWLNELSPKLYRTDLVREGTVAYGLVLILNEPNLHLRHRVERLLDLCRVEFRRGLSGGGNQLRQPYVYPAKWNPKEYPQVEHITDFSWYVGNYPELEHWKIKKLCTLLNQF